MTQISAPHTSLFNIRRSKSRPKETKLAPLNSSKRAQSQSRRPLSGHHKLTLITSTKIKITTPQFPKRLYDVKLPQRITINNFFPETKNPSHNEDLISTTSTFQPMTLKQTLGVTAESFCVMKKQTGSIIYQHQMSSRRQVASITKVMTAYTVLSLSKEFNIDIWNTLVGVEKEAAEIGGTTAELRLGDKLSVCDLIHGMMLPSGNDAAVALAYYFGNLILQSDSRVPTQQTLSLETSIAPRQNTGQKKEGYSKEALRLFIIKMNHIISFELKLKDTYFANSTGLQHCRSYSTAHDVAKIASAFLDSQILHDITLKKTYLCQVYNTKLLTHRSLTWKNTNALLWKRKDCTGLKTGYTPWAGPCLAAVFNILKQQNIIVVVLKSSAKEDRFSDADKLYQCYKKKF